MLSNDARKLLIAIRVDARPVARGKFCLGGERLGLMFLGLRLLQLGLGGNLLPVLHAFENGGRNIWVLRKGLVLMRGVVEIQLARLHRLTQSGLLRLDGLGLSQCDLLVLHLQAGVSLLHEAVLHVLRARHPGSEGVID